MFIYLFVQKDKVTQNMNLIKIVFFIFLFIICENIYEKEEPKKIQTAINAEKLVGNMFPVNSRYTQPTST